MTKRKKIIYIIVIFFLLFINGTALDDIATGSKPAYKLEYLAPVMSAAVFVLMAIDSLKTKKIKTLKGAFLLNIIKRNKWTEKNRPKRQAVNSVK